VSVVLARHYPTTILPSGPQDFGPQKINWLVTGWQNDLHSFRCAVQQLKMCNHNHDEKATMKLNPLPIVATLWASKN
jgi:hypothetical protein